MFQTSYFKPIVITVRTGKSQHNLGVTLRLDKYHKLTAWSTFVTSD